MAQDIKETAKTLADLAESLVSDKTRFDKEVKAIEKYVIKGPMPDLERAAVCMYALNHPNIPVLEAYFIMKI